MSLIVSCHLSFGNPAKTDIFPHNIQITFAAAVQRSGASYLLTVDTKPILFSLPLIFAAKVLSFYDVGNTQITEYLQCNEKETGGHRD